MKKFYNNTLKRIASDRGLRLLALLCVLLGMSNSAWAAYNIYGSSFLKLSFNDATSMEASGNVHSYSFTALGTGTERFRIYAGDKTDANYLGYSGNSTVTNDKDYKLKKNGNTEFSYYVVKDTKYTIQVTYYADDNIVLRITKGGGGGSTCTVSTSLLEATYDASTGNINLKGNFKTCGSKYHGFQWRKVGSQWCPENDFSKDYSNYVPLGSSDVDGEKTGSFKAEKGVTYEFRSYIVTTTSPWLTSGTITVTASAAGGNCKTIYLEPTGVWNEQNPKYDAYFWKSADKDDNLWIKDMSGDGCSGVYYVTVPEGYDKVLFGRRNPSKSDSDNWNNLWNQSVDLDVPTGDNTMYTITGWFDGKGTGSWKESTCDKTDCAPDVVISGNVLLTYNATYSYDESTSTGTGKLYGYYKQNPEQGGNECVNVTDYGFALCTGVGCTPSTITTLGSDYVQADNVAPDAIVERGQSFTTTTTSLPSGTVVGYRAYALINGVPTFSSEIRYLSTGGCIPQPGGGDTLRVVVDAETYFNSDTTKIDNCALRYGNLSRALTELKANREYVDANGNLLQPIIITVSNMPKSFTQEVACTDADGDGEPDKKEQAGIYKGVVRTVSGGDDGGTRNLNVLAIEGFNKNKTSDYHPLIIKSEKGHNPRLQHVLLRSSRGVVLDGFHILSNPDNCGKTADTALEMDNGRSNDWHLSLTQFVGAGIVVKNCMIGSNGFTGTHISAYDGITFENNIFNLSTEDMSPNAALWGASAKFIQCKNIKFVRNNLMGEHGTLIWLQETQNVLIYNNVFWNTNQYNAKCMAIGVYSQYNHASPADIACLYNTFYLADNDINSNNYDFFTAIPYSALSSASRAETQNITGSMTFMYNNCYSFDKDVKGADGGNISKFTGTKRFCPNNFWSVLEMGKTSSAFALDYDCGSNKEFINVANLLCESTASSPSQLVVRQPSSGDGLKVGEPVYADDVLGYCGGEIKLTDVELTHDRNHLKVRSGSSWTLGAFEASTGNTVNTIYWTGGLSNDWDDRGNWYWRDANNNDHMLTCVDFLSADVKIVIPEQNSTKYPVSTSGKYFIASIPDDFSPEARSENGSMNIPASEQVTAGKGLMDDANLTKYGSSIELEYGASLKGVENLKDGETYRYDSAITSLTVGRDQWTMVGPVVKPFANGKDGAVREVVSGDYFANYEPNVYMREANLDLSDQSAYDANWGLPFAELTREVPENTAFTINLPNSYGNRMEVPSNIYYWIIKPDDSKLNDYLLEKTLNQFVGRFINDVAMPTYTFDGSAKLLTNSYPHNISVEKLEGESNENGTVYVYDYENQEFNVVEAIQNHDGVIRPQHAFVFKPNVASLDVTRDMLIGGSTRSRSVVVKKPTALISLYAGSINSPVHSSIVVKMDQEVGGINTASLLNAPKVFSPYEGTPDLYMIHEGERYTRLCVGKETQTIPLGIRLKKAMYVEFAKCTSTDFSQVTLVDAITGREYDLLERSYVVNLLPEGETEGRFYLNLTPIDDEYIDDDEITTPIDEVVSDKSIALFTNQNEINIVTHNAELQTIYVSDLMGRVKIVKASGSFASLRMPVVKGVYIVKVVADGITRTEKVILK